MDYSIIKVRVRVRYADGKPGWFEAVLSPDCRNVVIGLDAVGIAGSYDPPTRPRLLEPISEQEFNEPMGMGGDGGSEAVEGGIRKATMARSADEPTLRSAQYASTDTTMAARTPDVCEYINGRWYCWTGVS